MDTHSQGKFCHEGLVQIGATLPRALACLRVCQHTTAGSLQGDSALVSAACPESRGSLDVQWGREEGTRPVFQSQVHQVGSFAYMIYDCPMPSPTPASFSHRVRTDSRQFILSTCPLYMPRPLSQLLTPQAAIVVQVPNRHQRPSRRSVACSVGNDQALCDFQEGDFPALGATWTGWAVKAEPAHKHHQQHPGFHHGSDDRMPGHP